MDCIEVGDLVAPKQNLQNRNRPDATLPAGRLGVVDAVGPTYIRVEIAWNTYYYARPEDLVIVEKEFLTDYAAVTRSPNIAAVWDLWATAARAAHETNAALTSLVESTRAEPRLARPGNS